MDLKIREHYIAVAALLVGIIAAVLIAPESSFFLPNFLYFWLPQGVVIALLSAFGIRPVAIAGCALAMTLHLIAYALWISSPHDALAWIGYLFSVPGAFAGAFIFGMIMKRAPDRSALFVGTAASASALTGIGIIQIGLCCTVLYCGFHCP